MPADQHIVMVAACGTNRVIGREGDVPWHLPEDFKHFKRTTMGHPMVMGRKTWQSFGGRPLPGRDHIILTREEGYQAPGATAVVHTLDAALAAAGPGTVMIIGGGEVYRLALPVADEIILSEVGQAPSGDTTFPELDETDWVETERVPHEGFDVVTYRRG